MITRPEFEAAVATPMVSRMHGPRVELDAPYVTEMVRAELVNRFGNAAYSDGYKVVTTIDSQLQNDANLALHTAIFEYDRRHGYRGPVARNALSGLAIRGGKEREQALQALLERYPGDDDLHPAVVLRLGSDNSAEFYVRDVGSMRIPWEGLRWRPFLTDDSVGAAPKSVQELLAVGDVIDVLHTLNRGWLLSQVPQVQSAFVAMDPKDGATVALSGGFDFFASNFNRAVQARRQPGSSFKPFIYSAALEHGFTPATLVNDAPLVFGDSELEEEWRPENNSREFNGPTRLREALVKSLNLVSVRVLMGTGIAAAIEHVKAFGFDDAALPHNLSLALGSGGASPWDMATGYCAFANGGHRVTHYFIDRIEDSNGHVVFQAEPPVACADCERQVQAMEGRADAIAPGQPSAPLEPQPRKPVGSPITEPLDDDGSSALSAGAYKLPEAPRIISAENAFMIYDMMRDVIKRGTGRRARDLGRGDIAGKTGTSNERRDTWFSGFNAGLVATVWVGFDQERSLGEREEGSQTALPVWKYFMARALKGLPEMPLQQPADLVAARISPDTGRLVAAGDSNAVFEFFRPADLAALENGAAGGNKPGVAISSSAEGTDIF